jgi:chromosomal replication initiator protein
MNSFHILYLRGILSVFVSDYNRLAFQFVTNFQYSQAPVVTVIVGKEGLGKTTFLQYLAHAAGEAEPLLLLDACKFASKYSFAAQKGDLNTFRQKVRSSKLFLLDNLQALKGKAKTSEELFYTLDTIFTAGGKAVLTFEGEDLAWGFLGERLASRLNSGLIIRLHDPRPEEISEFAAYYLASGPGDCRLDPAWLAKATSLKQVTSLIQNHLEVPAAEKRMDNVCFLGNLKDQAALVIPLVSDYFHVAAAKIDGQTRGAAMMKARYMVYLLLHEIFRYSYKDIALFFHRDRYNLRNRCEEIKALEGGAFETLCQKLYNQLDITFPH